jgi:cytochrome c-type biogenesis protein CcsB
MSLESTSFQLMNAAAVVYAGAMFAFAYDFAKTSRFVQVADDDTAEAPVAVGASGAAAPVATRRSRSRGSDRTEALPEPRSKAAGIAVSLTFLAFGLHLVALTMHAVGVGRVPWANMYEFSLSAALAGVAIYLALLRPYRLRWLGLFVVAPALLTVGLALVVLYPRTSDTIAPNVDSYWLVIHVSAAAISGGIFTFGAAVTLLYLLRERAETRAAAGELAGRTSILMTRVPPAATLDRLAFRVHAFVFPLWTFAVVSGAIWAENAWGRYWGWDPKETWAFITWVVYAGYLHARVTAGWKGRRAAVIALVGFATFLFNYFGVNLLLSGLHSYSGV